MNPIRFTNMLFNIIHLPVSLLSNSALPFRERFTRVPCVFMPSLGNRTHPLDPVSLGIRSSLCFRDVLALLHLRGLPWPPFSPPLPFSPAPLVILALPVDPGVRAPPVVPADPHVPSRRADQGILYRIKILFQWVLSQPDIYIPYNSVLQEHRRAGFVFFRCSTGKWCVSSREDFNREWINEYRVVCDHSARTLISRTDLH